MTDRLPALPDEDTLVFPDSLLRHLHPRHGGLPGPRVEVDKTAGEIARKLVEQARAGGDPIRLGDDSELAKLRRQLTAEASPERAAASVVFTALRTHERWVLPAREMTAFVDSWIVEHGPAFAACALVELGVILATRSGVGGWEATRSRHGYVADSDVWRETLRRTRTLLAAVDDREYREAVDRLAGHRRSPVQQVIVSYLVPTRQDWLDECRATRLVTGGAVTGRVAEEPWWLVSHAFSTADQLSAWTVMRPRNDCSMGLLVTLADGAGPVALPPFVQTLDEDLLDSDERRRVLEVIAHLPFDEAFQALVDRIDQKYVKPALTTAMRRFPARALRLLAAAGATEPLNDHVRANPELTAAMLPGLPDEARAAIESVLAADARVEESPADALPRLLVEPPWTRKRKARKPVVIAGLTPPGDQRMRWAPDEREAWAASHVSRRWPLLPEVTDWEEAITCFRDGRVPWCWDPRLLTQGPERLVRPLLAEWDRFRYEISDVPSLKSIVGRFGTDALPVMSWIERYYPADAAPLLLPCLNAEIAGLMAGWLRLKSVRQAAIAWFGRHGADAARMLFPAALGTVGTERRQAEEALRLLASKIGADEIVAAARDLGDEAGGGIEALLATDPLEILPARVPRIEDWLDPVLLPQILLRGRKKALPTAATGHVLTMLAMSKPGEVYAGIEVIREVCDPVSLAGFGWALFERWEQQGGPPKNGWALTQLGRLGDDETVRRLTEVIRAWPGKGAHRKAVDGVDVLAAIGTDVALMHLHGIAQKAKFKGLKTRAQEKIEQIAAALELSPERLADRLVPDFGLDSDGSMILDYGPRRFHVGFDEQLRPYVTDEDGRLLKALPKPGAEDDESATAAYKRFSGLKKDVKTVAEDTVRRLESAMVMRRRWAPAEFRMLFAEHPLVWHIARRLVWLSEEGGKTTAFRLAEDRTLADVEDDVLTLPESAKVGIAHPLDLGDDIPGWSRTLEDYEVLQPFPQIGRRVYALTEQESRIDRLTRFEGRDASFGKILGLDRRGWESGGSPDGGRDWISRELPGNRRIMIDLDPGFGLGSPDQVPVQKLDRIWLTDHAVDFSARHGSSFRFGDLDPATASEILADLTSLTGGVDAR